MFADRGNRGLLTRMLNLLLPEDGTVEEIEEYTDRERTADFLVGKGARLDLVCRGTDGRKFIVEMQNRREERFFERCVYYGSGLYREGVERGEEYEELRPVYVVGLLNYRLPLRDETLWNTDNIVSRYNMGEMRSGELARACEVAGFGKEKRLNYERDMITERDRIAQDKFARKEGRAEGFAEGLAKGESKGRAEGLAEGRTETAPAIAVRMLSDGMPLETVAKYSGLSEEEVRKLSQSKLD